MKSATRIFTVVLAAALQCAAANQPSQLDREFVVGSIAAELTAHFNLEGELQLEMLRPWRAPSRTASVWHVEITDYPSAPASSLLLRCRYIADGQLAGEDVMTFRAQLWRDAWVARQPVTANTGFDSSLLEARRTDFLRERDAVPAGGCDESFSFTRSVQNGRTLTWRDVARRPLVRKGDVVEVSVTDGALLITMKGLAMQNGAQGEAVTVRNTDSRRDFTAFVVDENRVQVRF